MPNAGVYLPSVTMYENATARPAGVNTVGALPVYSSLSPSASGATVPPATQLIDSNSAVWTVSHALCYLNGVQASDCSNVQTLLWFNGQVYVYNLYGQWYIWNGGGWNQVAGDPR